MGRAVQRISAAREVIITKFTHMLYLQDSVSFHSTTDHGLARSSLHIGGVVAAAALVLID
jgi:hypothetical protein